jgi:hypothetical protein
MNITTTVLVCPAVNDFLPVMKTLITWGLCHKFEIRSDTIH